MMSTDEMLDSLFVFFFVFASVENNFNVFIAIFQCSAKFENS